MKKLETTIFTLYLLGMFSIYFSITVSQGFFILSLVFFLVWFLKKIVAKEKIFWPLTFFLGMGLYVWGMLSDVVNGDAVGTFYEQRDFWLYLPVLIIDNVVQEKKDIERVFQWIASAAIVFGILGIVEALTSVSLKALFTHGEIVYLPQHFEAQPEISLFTGLSLTYAGLYFFPIVFFAYRLSTLFQQSYRHYFCDFFSKENLFYLFGFLISFLNILATGRRSALLAVLLVLPFIWWFKTHKKAPFALAMLALVLLFSLHQGFRQRIVNPFIGEASTNYRLLMYKAGVKSVGEHFVFGVGEKNFAKVLQEKNVRGEDGELLNYGHAHNDFLDRFVKGGFLSFVFLISLFLYMIFKMLQIKRKSFLIEPELYEYANMVLAVLLVFAIASQFQCYLIDDENLIFFTAILGIGEFLIRKEKNILSEPNV